MASHKRYLCPEVPSGHLTVVAISKTARRLTYNYDRSREFTMTLAINTLRWWWVVKRSGDNSKNLDSNYNFIGKRALMISRYFANLIVIDTKFFRNGDQNLRFHFHLISLLSITNNYCLPLCNWWWLTSKYMNLCTTWAV